ncbi:KpsF/GutQ family sugar-phosphate isomerase [Bacillus coahuilensis]|uniref:KpsF/GutQ family sugar-phosphate isomerase n=1 Tax=Bacillus coahuilensis TaxID=408580 RepID=UPI00075032F8|nr:KpsF/GutQ family sugar-phosphate isomerase [Bacillus coahuilensis]
MVINFTQTNFIKDAQDILKEEAAAIIETSNSLGSQFLEAVHLVKDCEGKLVVTGIGKSGLIGRKISATMSSLGIPSVYMSPAEGLHGDLGIIQSNDVVLAISKSGESQEISDILPAIKKIGANMIAMTANSYSSMAKSADVILEFSVAKEACHLNLAPTTSTTICLALGDALALVISKAKGFSHEDFALYHPGGSLGKRLTLHVEDLLSEDSYSFVHEDQDFKEVVMELTKRPLGGTVVLDSNNSLVGIITDGDLRRSLDNHKEDAFNLKASHIMTRNPIVIPKGLNAGKAISLMEEKTDKFLLSQLWKVLNILVF